jgi:3-hydroxybutyryl-CoA dehydratase
MGDIAVRRGLYFEDYQVGDKVTTRGRTITEADIVAFSALSGDWNPIHSNADYAAQGIFGERIAHGLLGLSVASGLADRMGFMEGTAVAFLGLDWKFRSPIKIGDTIRVEAEVAELKEARRLGGGIVTFNVAVANQRSEAVQRGTWSILVKFRPAEG